MSFQESGIDAMQAKGMCKHGNFPSRCTACKEENVSVERVKHDGDQNIPSETNRDLPERSVFSGESKESHREQYIKEVEACVQLEQLLMDAWKDSNKYDKAKDLLANKEYSEELRERFELIFSTWEKFETSQKRNEQLLQKYALETFGDANEESVARAVFFAKTGRDPVGKVFTYRDGPFFVVITDDVQDYAAINLGKTSLGTFHEYFPLTLRPKEIAKPEQLTPQEVLSDDDEPPEDIEASYPYVTPTVLLVRQDPSDPERVKSTIKHERQHFVNNILLDIKKKKDRETMSAEEWKESVTEIGLKDEILANVRQGSTGEKMVEKLSRPAYARLFPENKGEERRVILREIGNELSNIEKSFSADEQRALLTYAVVDIPLKRIAARLRTFARIHANVRSSPVIET